mgnify:CR=1 FL=1
MTKLKLSDAGYSEFYFTHKQQAPKQKDRERKQKLVSTDKFDDAIQDIVKDPAVRSRTQPVILTNAAGADTPLSLYANIANIHPRRLPPQLLVIDRKRVNLENINYRATVAALSKNRKEYLTNVFGLPEGKITKDIFDKKGAIDLVELRKILRRNDYDADKHSMDLEKMLDTGCFATNYADLDFVKMAVMSIANHLESKSSYKDFIDQFLEILHLNPKTHYLNDEELYKHMTKLLVPEKQKWNMHLTKLDIGTPTGLEKVRELLNSYDLGSDEPCVTASFIPHAMKNMANIFPFLRENTLYTMYCEQRLGEQNRKAITTPSRTLTPQIHEIPWLSKYKKEAANYKPLKNLIAMETDRKSTRLNSSHYS